MHWILLYCPNIVYFTINNVNFTNSEVSSYENVFWPYYPFPQLIPRMENLTLFKFESEFLEYDLHNFSSDFPKVKTLATSIVEERYENPFEGILQLITTESTRVDNLTINLEGDEYYTFPAVPELNLLFMQKYDLSK